MHPANMVLTLAPRIVSSFANFERVQSYLLESTRHDARAMQNGKVSLQHATIEARAAVHPVLKDINLEIQQPSFIAISGPVGSGKTLFAKVLLGEVLLQQGVVKVPTRRIGLCTQTAWLPDGTIQEVICNFEPEIDTLWYEKVLDACCLNHDLDVLADGDGTVVGTQGMNLSGGQRQRVVCINPWHGIFASD